MDFPRTHDSGMVYPAVHLYDRYGTFLIGFLPRAEAERLGIRAFSSQEEAERVVRHRMEYLDRMSRQQYRAGVRGLFRMSRQPDQPLLRQFFGPALRELEYDGWVEGL